VAHAHALAMPDSIQRVTVERSPDNQNWTLKNPPNGSNGPLNQWTDTETPNPTWYYRVTEYTVNGLVVPHDIGVITQSATPGTAIWAGDVGFNIPGSGAAYVICTCAVSDSHGNVYVAGIGNMSGPGSSTKIPCLAKLSPSGQVLWYQEYSLVYGGIAQPSFTSIAVDGSDNVVATGYFFRAINFSATTDGGAFSPTVGTPAPTLHSTGDTGPGSGTWNSFVVKISGGSTTYPIHLWSLAFGSTAQPSPDLQGAEGGFGIACDLANNIVATGVYLGPMTVSGPNGENPISVPNSGGTLSNFIYLLKLSPSGVPIWANGYGSGTSPQGSGQGNAVSISRETNPANPNYGAIALTGFFSFTMNFRNSVPPITASSQAGLPPASDIFVAKFNASGLCQWAKGFGGTDNDSGQAISFDGNGDVIAGGWFQGSAVAFGSFSLTSNGREDIFLMKLSGTSGAVTWASGYGGPFTDKCKALVVDSSNNVSIVASFANTFKIGTFTVTAENISDALAAKFDPNGNPIFARSLGITATSPPNVKYGLGVALTPSGIVAVGIATSSDQHSVAGPVNFGNSITITPKGISDIFAVQLSP